LKAVIGVETHVWGVVVVQVVNNSLYVFPLLLHELDPAQPVRKLIGTVTA